LKKFVIGDVLCDRQSGAYVFFMGRNGVDGTLFLGAPCSRRGRICGDLNYALKLDRYDKVYNYYGDGYSKAVSLTPEQQVVDEGEET